MNKIIIAVAIICISIGILIGFGISMIPEHKCIKNPLYYGISSLETNDLKVTCNCYMDNWGYMPFTFNKTGVFPINGGN
jgi:hypothetical protein